MEKAVQDFLKSDRQWLRDQRISHAQHQLSSAKTDDEKAFWTAVLEANKR